MKIEINKPEWPVTVLGLGGSLAANSKSLMALKIALEGAAELQVTTKLMDLRDLDLPMYRPGTSGVPAEVQRMAEAVHSAQGLLWSSPLITARSVALSKTQSTGSKF